MPYGYLKTIKDSARIVGAAACALALLGWNSAAAQLTVSESVIELQASEQQSTIQVSNTGAAPVRVSISLQAVPAPGDLGPAHEVTVPVLPEIMRIEPNHFEIQPKQSIDVNVHRAARDLKRDEVYRMHIKPDLNASRGGSNIRLSYDLLVMVRPDSSSPEIQITKTPAGFALVNQGNSNALLSSMQMCDELNVSCHSLPTVRMYAQQVLPLPVPEEIDSNYIVIKTTQSHREKRSQINYRMPYKSESSAAQRVY